MPRKETNEEGQNIVNLIIKSTLFLKYMRKLSREETRKREISIDVQRLVRQ